MKDEDINAFISFDFYKNERVCCELETTSQSQSDAIQKLFCEDLTYQENYLLLAVKLLTARTEAKNKAALAAHIAKALKPT